jgi:acyl carrier protein
MATLEDQFKFAIDPETLCVDVFATVGSLIEYVRSRMHGR